MGDEGKVEALSTVSHLSHVGLVEGSVLVLVHSTDPGVDEAVFVQAGVFILPAEPHSAVLVEVPGKAAALGLEVEPGSHALVAETSLLSNSTPDIHVHLCPTWAVSGVVPIVAIVECPVLPILFKLLADPTVSKMGTSGIVSKATRHLTKLG